MPISSYEIGLAFAATGTGISATSSTVVVGSGTAFATDFRAGYLITIGSETRVVATVASATGLTVTTAFTTASTDAALTGVSMVNLESLTRSVYPPKSLFTPGPDYRELGTGGVRVAGSPQATWRWGALSKTDNAEARQAKRNQLRVYIPDASTAVYIRTAINDSTDAFRYFSTVGIWPRGPEDKDAGARLDFSIEFVAMSEVSVG